MPYLTVIRPSGVENLRRVSEPIKHAEGNAFPLVGFEYRRDVIVDAGFEVPNGNVDVGDKRRLCRHLCPDCRRQRQQLNLSDCNGRACGRNAARTGKTENSERSDEEVCTHRRQDSSKMPGCGSLDERWLGAGT
jgi:hypothetical protein